MVVDSINFLAPRPRIPDYLVELWKAAKQLKRLHLVLYCPTATIAPVPHHRGFFLSAAILKLSSRTRVGPRAHPIDHLVPLVRGKKIDPFRSVAPRSRHTLSIHRHFVLRPTTRMGRSAKVYKKPVSNLKFFSKSQAHY